MEVRRSKPVPMICSDEGDVWEIQTAMADFNAVREAFEAAGRGNGIVRPELNQVPQTTDGSRSPKPPASFMRFIDAA